MYRYAWACYEGLLFNLLFLLPLKIIILNE